MKRYIFVILSLIVLSNLLSNDNHMNVPVGQAIYPNFISNHNRDNERLAPVWTFNNLPTSILMSYNDYMIGGYNNLPMQLIPDAMGGGYFLTFHAKRTATGTRRVIYSYIEQNGTVHNTNDLTTDTYAQGYSAMDIDPISGKPIYAWHSPVDTDTSQEVMVSWDRLLEGVPGSLTTPALIIDNPITITSPSGITTTNNEFNWPIVKIGPSPSVGMQRVYVLTRNYSIYNFTSENPLIAWADFTSTMLETGSPLVWNQVHIPVLDDWHVVTDWKQPSYGFTVGNDGRIYLAGHHKSQTPEADMDVFVCENYGEGTWQHYSAFSNFPSWNPPTQNGAGPGFFMNPVNVPFTDSQMRWKIQNARNVNAVIDDNGLIHVTAMWMLSNSNNVDYPSFNTIKEFVFDTNTHQFDIREVYPIAGTSSDSLRWQPWDADGNGIVDQYDQATGNPLMRDDWNFCYWDDNVSYMRDDYNFYKITEPNAQGWMASLWQNSYKARRCNYYGDSQYAAYTTVPEIYISVSPDNGLNWSEPIIINSVETAQFSGNRPMWAYPSDKIKYEGIINGHPVGKLGLMYYHDFTWGSYNGSSTGPEDGGIVKFMTINIEFPMQGISGISGIVKRIDNQLPIANATITSGLYTAISNEQGTYVMNMPAGSYTVTASAEGYVPMIVNNVVVTNNQSTTLDFSLNEITNPATEVVASIQTGNSAVLIQWDSPVSGSNLSFDLEKKLKDSQMIPKSSVVNLRDRNLTGFKIWLLINGQENNDEAWILIGTVPATDNSIIDTSWENLAANTYRYAVKAVYSGSILSSPSFSNTVIKPVVNSDPSNSPSITRIISASPNPFVSTVSISYELKSNSPARLDIFNINGQHIKTLNTALSQKGINHIVWDGTNDRGDKVGSGLYLYRLDAEGQIFTKKMMFLK